MSLHVAVVCTVAVLSCLVLHSQAVNPGFRTIITKKGLDYGMYIHVLILLSSIIITSIAVYMNSLALPTELASYNKQLSYHTCMG